MMFIRRLSWLLLFAMLPPSFARAAARQPLGPEGQNRWRITFQDEFDGKAIDESKWTQSHRGQVLHWQGTPSEEADDHGCLDGRGHLVLRVSRADDGVYRYHHGWSTKDKFQQTYGYFETRARFSREPGFWGAVWLNGSTKGPNPFVYGQEIDIFEDFYKPKKVFDFQHCVHIDAQLEAASEDDRNVGMMEAPALSRVSRGHKLLVDDWDAFHVVACRWTPLEYVFYCDGKETFRLDYRQVPVTNQPMHLLISMCFRDGRTRGYVGDYTKANLPDQLVVDYVRAWEEDVADEARPQVSLAVDRSSAADSSASWPVRITATKGEGKIERLYLFTNGRIRWEGRGESASFELPRARLHEGSNRLIAMAVTSAGYVGQSQPLDLDNRP